MSQREEKMVLFATSIAMELAKDLDLDELEDLRALINQISCSLTTLINSRYNFQKRHDRFRK